MKKTKTLVTSIGVIATAAFLITLFSEGNELIPKINNLAKVLMMLSFVIMLSLVGFKNKNKA